MNRGTAITLLFAGALSVRPIMAQTQKPETLTANSQKLGWSTALPQADSLRVTMRVDHDKDLMVVTWKGKTKEIPMQEVWDAL